MKPSAAHPEGAAPAAVPAGSPWRARLGVTAAAALAALGLLAWLAPGYLTRRGFPLDDAWIHAVYGRELARSGMLAYNPGVPATGATSPLWAGLLALVHLCLASPGGVVLATKLLGLALLAACALLAPAAVGAGEGKVGWLVAALLLLHPPLLAASASGMEVSLAALSAFGLLALARRGRAPAYGAACALAPLARPELVLLALALPVARLGRERWRAVRLLAAAAAGAALSLGLSAWRNWAASGRPLPATFYAKVHVPLGAVPGSVSRGLSALLGDLPLTGLPLLCLATLLSATALGSRRASAPRDAAVAWLAGLGLCVLSFVLVPPIDPVAFYHQRYALPGVALLLAAAPPLLVWALSLVPTRIRRWAGAAVAAAAALGLALDAPGRLSHLENDAHNIDDVQVTEGRALASAPPDARVWAVDAGAIRYFGRAFVVDMMGLNSWQILGSGAGAFLAGHPPAFLEVVPGWSALEPLDQPGGEAHRYLPTTPYTVTSFPDMQLHVLVRCASGSAGTFHLRGRSYPFACAP
jgi:hypothetical protein